MRMKQLLHIIIFISLTFISCKEQIQDLNGHWHIEALNKEANNSYSYLHVVDIVNDTTAIFGSYGGLYNGIWGYLDQPNKMLGYGGEDIFGRFSYQLKRNKLVLTELDVSNGQEAVKFIGYKCNESCCNKQEEFFNEYNVNVDLPIAKSFSQLDTIASWGLTHLIILGISKINNQSNFNKKHQLILGNRIATINELELFNEIANIKTPENKRDQIKYVIFADKATPMSDIFKVFAKQSELGIKTIYIALREKDVYKKLNIWLKKVDLSQINYNQDLTLKKWLAQI